MIKIKYNNSSNFIDVTFIKNSEHLVTLKGLSEVSNSGFTTWRMDSKTQLGNFSDFVTVYRELEDGIQYSNDGSIYTEPEQIEYSNILPIPEVNNEPSQLDIIEAQVMWTALQTNTLLENDELEESDNE